jgi:hypothetical protein
MRVAILDGDGCIDSADYAEVLANLASECTPAVICHWDVDGDYDVDYDDLAVIYSKLCPIGPNPPRCCQACPSSLMEEDEESLLQDIIEVILLSDQSEEVKETLLALLLGS